MKSVVISYNSYLNVHSCHGFGSVNDIPCLADIDYEYTGEENERGFEIVYRATGAVIGYDCGSNERTIINPVNEPYTMYTTITEFGESDNELENVAIAEAVGMWLNSCAVAGLNGLNDDERAWYTMVIEFLKNY